MVYGKAGADGISRDGDDEDEEDKGKGEDAEGFHRRLQLMREMRAGSGITVLQAKGVGKSFVGWVRSAGTMRRRGSRSMQR